MTVYEIAESKKSHIEKETSQKILDSFLQSLIFDFEEYAYQNPVMIERLRKVSLVFNSKDQCYTSNQTIVIGTNDPVINGEIDPYIAMKRTQGIIAKELAHILYTNSKDYGSFLDRSVQKYQKGSSVAKHVFNVFEGYRVEHRFSESNNYYKKIFFMKRYPAIKNLLQKWNSRTPNSDNEIATAAVDSFSIMAFTKKPVFSKNKKLNAIVLTLYPIVMKVHTAKDTNEIANLAHKALAIFDKLNLNLDKDTISPEASAEAPKLNSRMGSGDPLGGEEEDGSGSGGGGTPGTSPSDQVGSGMATPTPDMLSDITANLEKEIEDSKKLEDELDEQIDEHLNEIEQEAINEQKIRDFLYGEKSEAKEEVKFQEEKKITDLGQSMPEIHKGKTLKVANRFQRYHIDDYQQQVNALSLPISKLVNKISELKQLKMEDYEYYLKSGSLDSSALVRFVSFNDTDVFKQENIEEENMSMDVMILVDCSGSNAAGVYNKKNNTSVSRYQVNQMMAVYLHESLKRLKFPHAIWGFDSTSTENIHPMVGFVDCFDPDSGLNLKDIAARSNNRDGYHIRIAGQHLNNHAKSNKKLLIVISDGQPASDGYYGPSAMKDIVDTQEELKKLGVVTAGIFTGSEDENKYFEDMYEKAHFLNNESIFDFEKELFTLISNEFEDDDEIHY